MLLGAFLVCTRLILHDCSCTLLKKNGIPRKRRRVTCLNNPNWHLITPDGPPRERSVLFLQGIWSYALKYENNSNQMLPIKSGTLERIPSLYDKYSGLMNYT